MCANPMSGRSPSSTAAPQLRAPATLGAPCARLASSRTSPRSHSHPSPHASPSPTCARHPVYTHHTLPRLCAVPTSHPLATSYARASELVALTLRYEPLLCVLLPSGAQITCSRPEPAWHLTQASIPYGNSLWAPRYAPLPRGQSGACESVDPFRAHWCSRCYRLR